MYYFNAPMSVYRYRSKGSWSARNHADRELSVETHCALADMLRKADTYSGGVHHRLFVNAIAEQEFMALNSKGEWRKMLTKKYKKVFSACSVKKRIRIVVSVAVPLAGRVLSR